MPDGITHSNKDVLFKFLSRQYENKSLAAYGLKLPRIKRLLSGNYPTVTATEIYADNPFLLEDDSLLILEYESTVKEEDFLKYCKYTINAVERLRNEGTKVKRVVIAVIYTGDIKTAPSMFDLGALNIQVEQVFLSNFNTDEIYAEIRDKIDAGLCLDDDDVMKFIILPLTQPDKNRKQELIEDTIELAKRVQDEYQQVFIMAGILTATDKFIGRKYSEMIKEWIKMTKVARLFEEEKIEAVNEARREERMQIAKDMLAIGDDILKVMKITKLTRTEVEELQVSVGA